MSLQNPQASTSQALQPLPFPTSHLYLGQRSNRSWPVPIGGSPSWESSTGPTAVQEDPNGQGWCVGLIDHKQLTLLWGYLNHLLFVGSPKFSGGLADQFAMTKKRPQKMISKVFCPSTNSSSSTLAKNSSKPRGGGTAWNLLKGVIAHPNFS